MSIWPVGKFDTKELYGQALVEAGVNIDNAESIVDVVMQECNDLFYLNGSVTIAFVQRLQKRIAEISENIDSLIAIDTMMCQCQYQSQVDADFGKVFPTEQWNNHIARFRLIIGITN